MCKRNSNFTEIYEILKSNIYGQSIAINHLRDIFKYKIIDQKEPISIHIVGDNGIGKSMTSNSLSNQI
jgi:predicted GTPase